MQYHLVRRDVFPHTNIAHDFTRQFAAFGVINLPADDFPTKNIHEQIQVKVDALHRCRQIRDVPTEQLLGRRGTERTRFMTPLRGAFGTPMPELILGSHDAVKA
jgi:hypothetical protein